MNNCFGQAIVTYHSNINLPMITNLNRHSCRIIINIHISYQLTKLNLLKLKTEDIDDVVAYLKYN